MWSEIDHAFAKPVTPTDRTAEYAPTQILADLFRAAGYDGVAYGSALGHGLNIALFDIDAAEVTRCELFQTLNVTFTFSDSFAFRPIL